MPHHHTAHPICPKKQQTSGFSLLELMIVLLILGLLAAISYPRYTEQLARSKRTEARIALLENAHFLENHRTTYGYYGHALHSNTAPELPVTELPRQNNTAPYYTLEAQVSDEGYTLQATPVGTMTDDACHSYRVDHTGANTLWQNNTELTDTALLHRCWEQ